MGRGVIYRRKRKETKVWRLGFHRLSAMKERENNVRERKRREKIGDRWRLTGPGLRFG